MLAEVHYEVLADGSVVILDFVDFLDYEDIKEKFGAEVARIYFNQPVKMEHRLHGKHPSIVTENGEIFIGGRYSRKSFGSVVSEMKAAGRKLSQIVKTVNEHVPVVKVVKI